MNDEQIKMLIELASSTSEGAMWLVVAWLGVKVIGWIIFGVTLILVTRYVVRAFQQAGDAEALLGHFAYQLDVPFYETWRASKRQAIKEALHRLIEAGRNAH